jgi:hypothetical protein
MKSVILLSAIFASGMPQESQPGHPVSAYSAVGPVHREVANTSPVAKEVIELIAPKKGMVQYKIAIRSTLYNLTNHELIYVDPRQYFDVQNLKTGKRADSSPTGCYVNFFLDCYTPSMPIGRPGTGFGVTGTGVPNDVIPAQGSVGITPDDYIDMYYRLEPGEYSVVGIYCASKREGPECFKSNKITIQVPVREK